LFEASLALQATVSEGSASQPVAVVSKREFCTSVWLQSSIRSLFRSPHGPTKVAPPALAPAVVASPAVAPALIVLPPMVVPPLSELLPAAPLGEPAPAGCPPLVLSMAPPSPPADALSLPAFSVAFEPAASSPPAVDAPAASSARYS